MAENQKEKEDNRSRSEGIQLFELLSTQSLTQIKGWKIHTKGLESTKKNQMKILNPKNTVTEIRNSTGLKADWTHKKSGKQVYFHSQINAE